MTNAEMTNDQIPMTNKTPMTNDQCGCSRWSLVIGHLLVIGIWSLVIALAACERGQALQSSAKTPKIASLVPAATDLIVAMGAGDHLVAVSNWDQALPEVRNLPVGGNYDGPDWEKIAQARPDVMIIFMAGDRMPSGIKQRADQLSIQVVNVKTERVEDIFKTITYLGELVKESEKAQALSQKMRSQLDAVAKQVEGKSKVPVLLVRDEDGF